MSEQAVRLRAGTEGAESAGIIGYYRKGRADDPVERRNRSIGMTELRSRPSILRLKATRHEIQSAYIVDGVRVYKDRLGRSGENLSRAKSAFRLRRRSNDYDNVPPILREQPPSHQPRNRSRRGG